MLKCFAVICLIVAVSAASDWESAQAGKKSQRMNLLSKTVGARMLAGTNGQMDTGFQPMSSTGSQFVPIARQSNAAMNTMQQQQPFTGGQQTMDNSLNGGQQLTPEQLQQLHQFLSAQTQSQQSQQRTVNTQQPMQQPMQTQQPMQQQQQFRMDTTGVTGMNPTGTTGAVAGGMDTTSMFADQQSMGNQFGQGRMANPSVAAPAIPNTTPFMPVTSKSATPMGMMPTGTQQTASKPSALEQQLLDQQILTQKLKEQLLQQQQQQKLQQQQQGKMQQQQPTTPVDQSTMTTTTGFGGLSQATEQLTQEQKLQRMTQQQQQQQQQQLLDQINQLNQLNQQQQQQGQGRNTQTPSAQTQVPSGFQQTPNGFQPIPGTSQALGNFQTPVSQTAQGFGTQQPTNSSRMMMNNQMRTTTGNTFGGKPQGRVGGGDICAGAQPGELLPHPLDETQFIVCNELGEITLMDCPNHTVFNPHLKLCDLTSDMPLLCKANPCLNGAKCVEVSPIQFRCECPQGFSGKTCEKFDTCQSSKPCGADGVCLSFALGSPIPHVCLCNGGRTVGLTCAQGEQNPCTFPGSSTKLMPVNFNRAVFAHCEGARPHFKFCQPPLMFSGSKQACEWTI